MSNTNVWALAIRIYAALLCIFGVFMAIFFLRISYPNASSESEWNYIFLTMIPFAIIFIWVGYKAARKLTHGSIRLLAVATLFLLLNIIVDINMYVISQFGDLDTMETALASALAFPVAFVLYFVIVKTLTYLVFGKSDIDSTPNKTLKSTPENGAT